MAKKSDPTIIRLVRDRRGLTQEALCRLSGCADATVRRTERDPKAVSADTLRSVLDALASVAPFTLVETAEIADEVGWSFETVDAISAAAKPLGPSERGQGRDKIERALAALHDFEDPVGDLLDALARLCSAVSDRAQIDVLHNDQLPRLARQIAHSHIVELKPEHDPEGHSGQYRFTATLPRTVDGTGGPAPVVYFDESGRRLSLSVDEPLVPSVRVVRVPERQPDGSLIERFDYYKPDGTRLVPADELLPDQPRATPPASQRKAN